MAAKMNRVVYQFKVTLRSVQPAVWRRFQVWEDASLGQLHSILQIAMGWEDCHLHQFKIGQNVYSVPDPDDHSARLGLSTRTEKNCTMSSSASPEDVGGPAGCADYLEAMADSKHEQHASLLQWRGRFDPESFSLANVNSQLHKAFRAARSTAATPLWPQNRPN